MHKAIRTEFPALLLLIRKVNLCSKYSMKKIKFLKMENLKSIFRVCFAHRKEEKNLMWHSHDFFLPCIRRVKFRRKRIEVLLREQHS